MLFEAVDKDAVIYLFNPYGKVERRTIKARDVYYIGWSSVEHIEFFQRPGGATMKLTADYRGLIVRYRDRGTVYSNQVNEATSQPEGAGPFEEHILRDGESLTLGDMVETLVSVDFLNPLGVIADKTNGA